jgi:uncharacterized protein (DUF342 family)
MTPEEIRNTIEQMLAVQRQIQESQIRNTDNIARLELQVQANAELIQAQNRQFQEFTRSNREDISTLVAEIAKLTVDQREKFNQFYGYHQAADSDRLNLLERLIKVEQEIAQIKQQLRDSQ